MIARICAREACGRPFSVKYQSDPKRFCQRRCSGLEVAGPKTMTPVEAGRRSLAARHRASHGRIIRLVEGLGEVQAFKAGVRVARRFAARLSDGRRGGELELLVREAIQD
jgi:hypothetical protein